MEDLLSCYNLSTCFRSKLQYRISQDHTLHVDKGDIDPANQRNRLIALFMNSSNLLSVDF